MAGTPVVFIHGMFMTALCWDGWAERFDAAGHTPTAFEWPNRDASVEELRAAHPDPRLGRLTLARIVDEHASRLATLPDAPVLVGHSMGGLIVQLLVGRGLGAAGVAIDSAPPMGVFTPKWSFLKSNWPMISPFSPAGEPRLIPLEDFRYAFANTLPPDVQEDLYMRYIVPESRMVPRQSLTSVARIDFARPHVPLLFVAGGSDHIIPASLNRTNARRYRASDSLTDLREFEGRDHMTIVEPGWEDVADFVAQWIDRLPAGTAIAAGAA
jgi:pimeloyl-ACP methyl ester carboxylesterase